MSEPNENMTPETEEQDTPVEATDDTEEEEEEETSPDEEAPPSSAVTATYDGPSDVIVIRDGAVSVARGEEFTTTEEELSQLQSLGDHQFTRK